MAPLLYMVKDYALKEKAKIRRGLTPPPFNKKKEKEVSYYEVNYLKNNSLCFSNNIFINIKSSYSLLIKSDCKGLSAP